MPNHGKRRAYDLSADRDRTAMARNLRALWRHRASEHFGLQSDPGLALSLSLFCL